MEIIYKISAKRGSKKPSQQSGDDLPAVPGAVSVRPMSLSLLVVTMTMLICILASVTQVSARPSDAVSAAAAVPSLPAADHSSPAKLQRRDRRSAEDEHYNGDDYYDEDYLRVKRCYEDEDVNELCQRCSKVTKSALVFPMCCSNEDETMDWCKAYVYYGIQN
ncbi:uncharacterized protein LOC128743716 [Sabethes cyaneus]|uniref:uncharacterized protein LOC128743716 n=1 Tax=Sabethes cyaneus TaxID=53552 RepID=UPI00237D48C0|nr:uncharacterized protein LOC128743716 [Sabethes cyaneus]